MFSVERAYTVRYSMPSSFAWRESAISAFIPSACPRLRGRSRFFAHLPLPSIISPT